MSRLPVADPGPAMALAGAPEPVAVAQEKGWGIIEID